ncbi:unnamed protein product [Lactuca virosa]|uniref:Uncharacterized protein n=1 Tax=Lactuca virosa TaxID=75947 RepID=A0AAU9PED9_9ASTR|nr:unnamed protein product [Lactuca virosa]
MNNLDYIMYNKKLKKKCIKRAKLKECDPLVVEHIWSNDEWIASPSDGEEDDIGGGGKFGEEDGEVIGSARGGGLLEDLEVAGQLGKGVELGKGKMFK